MGNRLVVGRWVLVPETGVRIPVPQQPVETDLRAYLYKKRNVPMCDTGDLYGVHLVVAHLRSSSR